jgi:hypothetical protein
VSDEVHPEEDIFAEALAIPDLEERRSYLSEACGENDALRSRLERLLHATERSDQLFGHIDRPEAEADDAEPPGEKTGEWIGP